MITITTSVAATPEKAWEYWTSPEHIIHWNHASDDWHCPAAANDLRAGGAFSFTMAAKDGSFSFDFGGTHEIVEPLQRIASKLGDGRKMEVRFIASDGQTVVEETFEPETTNPVGMQRQGWQAILDNFRKHTEQQ